MPNQPFTLLYDATGTPAATAYAPVTARPATALYSPQGGLLALGSDYAGKAQAPKVDASGNQYVVTQSPGGGASTYQAQSTVSSASTVYGPVMMGLQSTTVLPIRMDTLGCLVDAPDQYPTFSVVASNVSLATNKSILALVNKSTAGAVVRIVGVFCQGTGTATSTLLTSYNLVAYELRPITGISAAGSTLAALAYDTADTLDAAITCYTGATVTGDTRGALRRWSSSNYGNTAGGGQQEIATGDEQGRTPWVQRSDVNAKHVVVRPGAGIHIRASSTATINQVDATFVFTVATA